MELQHRGPVTLLSPAISPNATTVYIGSHDSKLHAVHAANGARQWTCPTGGPVDSSPAVSNDGTAVHIGNGSDDHQKLHDHKLHAVHANGTRKWTYPTGGPVDSSPAVSIDDATVYIGSHDNKLHAVCAANGTAQWAYTTGGNVASSPAVSSDGATLYVGSCEPSCTSCLRESSMQSRSILAVWSGSSTALPLPRTLLSSSMRGLTCAGMPTPRPRPRRCARVRGRRAGFATPTRRPSNRCGTRAARPTSTTRRTRAPGGSNARGLRLRRSRTPSPTRCT